MKFFIWIFDDSLEILLSILTREVNFLFKSFHSWGVKQFCFINSFLERIFSEKLIDRLSFYFDGRLKHLIKIKGLKLLEMLDPKRGLVDGRLQKFALILFVIAPFDSDKFRIIVLNPSIIDFNA